MFDGAGAGACALIIGLFVIVGVVGLYAVVFVFAPGGACMLSGCEYIKPLIILLTIIAVIAGIWAIRGQKRY